MADISKDAALDAPSPGFHEIVDASNTIHADIQIYASGNALTSPPIPSRPTDLDLVDGRHRHIMYD